MPKRQKALENIEKIIQLIRPFLLKDPRRRIASGIIFAGIAIIANPFWVPWIESFILSFVCKEGSLENSTCFYSRNFNQIDQGAFYSGWILIFVSIALLVWWDICDRRNKLEEKGADKKGLEILSTQSDKKIFSRFLAQFPPNGEMAYFLKDVDVGNAIRDHWLTQISNFLQEWDSPIYKFDDPRLEEKRKHLIEKLKFFLREMYLNTRLVRDDLRSMELNDLDNDNPRWEKMDELNSLGTEAYHLYQDLIGACRSIIGFPESD